MTAAKFQSTPPQGERRIKFGLNFFRFIFQSTPPQGERHIPGQNLSPVLDFNPRPHKGSDVRLSFDDCYRSIISIHAPTRGATEFPEEYISETGFQSTPPQGERPICTVCTAPRSYFNPRPHKGSDRGPLRQCNEPVYFNPRPHKGSDLLSPSQQR